MRTPGPVAFAEGVGATERLAARRASVTRALTGADFLLGLAIGVGSARRRGGRSPFHPGAPSGPSGPVVRIDHAVLPEAARWLYGGARPGATFGGFRQTSRTARSFASVSHAGAKRRVARSPPRRYNIVSAF